MLGKAWPNKILDPSEGSLVPAYCSNNCGLGDLVRRIREYAVLLRGTLTGELFLFGHLTSRAAFVAHGTLLFHAAENREMHRNTKEITLHACKCCVHLIPTILGRRSAFPVHLQRFGSGSAAPLSIPTYFRPSYKHLTSSVPSIPPEPRDEAFQPHSVEVAYSR